MNFLAMFDSNSSITDLLTIIPIAGVTIVFAMLIILVIIIAMFGKIMSAIKGKEKTVAENKVSTPTPIYAPQSDEDEIIAVIAAAVDAMYSTSGKKAVIRSIKPSVSGGRSAWAQAGLVDNVRAF